MLTIGLGLTVASSLGWVAADVLRKRLTTTLPPMTLAIRLAFFQGLILLLAMPLLLSSPAIGTWSQWSVSSSYWAYALPTYLCTAIGHITFLRAIHVSDLGLTIPFLSFSPIFVMLFGIVFLQEIPTTTSFVGVIIVVLGAFILNPTRRTASPTAQGSSTGRLGALLMLSTAVLWSAGAAFDKAALKHASPLTHLALLLGSSVLILHLVRTLFIREPKASFTVSWKPLFLVCATMLISIALQLAAYSHWEVAYIETIKRAIGLVGSVTLGALIFKERGFRRRLFSVCVMAIGTTILILGQ